MVVAVLSTALIDIVVSTIMVRILLETTFTIASLRLLLFAASATAAASTTFW